MKVIKKMKGYILVLRPHYWLPSIVPSIAGALVASHTLSLKNLILLVFIFGPGIAGACEAINDYFDKEYDSINGIKRIWKLPISGGSGVLQLKLLTPNEVLVLSIFLILSSLLISLLLTNFFFLSLLLTGTILGITYSMPPLRFKEKGLLGPLSIAISYGFITFSCGWSLVSPIEIKTILIGSLLSILVFGSVGIIYLLDFLEDMQNKIKTIPIQIGFKRAKDIFAIFHVLPFILAFIFSMVRLLSINYLVFIPLFLLALIVAMSLIYEQTININRMAKIKLLSLIPESFMGFCFLV